MSMHRFLVTWKGQHDRWEAKEIMAGNPESAVRAARPVSYHVQVFNLDEQGAVFATSTAFEVTPR